ncbi:hypothetical protein B381_02856 [Stutzerimonas stutzeri NF13]|uniref:Uncharacterized protein n=1 Tax=Stutzerimonas stutzeri NF13 TaxID=1212548 RepID=M2VP33_STUST|nr:hypothetical protein B381_02856 [Stutzerimonas stutzeri NF13]
MALKPRNISLAREIFSSKLNLKRTLSKLHLWYITLIANRFIRKTVKGIGIPIEFFLQRNHLHPQAVFYILRSSQRT